MDKLKQHLPAIAAGAAGIAAIGLAWFLMSGSEDAAEPAPNARSASAAAVAPPSRKAVEGDITREQLLHVLDDMLRAVEKIIAERDSKRAAAIAAGTPEEAADEEAGEFLQNGMAELDEELQSRHGISQTQLQEAQERYGSDDPEIKQRLNDLQVLIIGREEMEEMARMADAAPADMTADRFLPIFERHLRHVEGAMNELVEMVKEQTQGRSQEQKQQFFQFMLMQNLQRIQMQAVEATGMEADEFQGCMVKFGQDPRMAALVTATQQRQNAKMGEFTGSA